MASRVRGFLNMYLKIALLENITREIKRHEAGKRGACADVTPSVTRSPGVATLRSLHTRPSDRGPPADGVRSRRCAVRRSPVSRARCPRSRRLSGSPLPPPTNSRLRVLTFPSSRHPCGLHPTTAPRTGEQAGDAPGHTAARGPCGAPRGWLRRLPRGALVFPAQLDSGATSCRAGHAGRQSRRARGLPSSPRSPRNHTVAMALGPATTFPQMSSP